MILKGLFNFYQHLRLKRPEGQVATIFIVLIALVFIFMAIIINLGKITQEKTALDNAADGAALMYASTIGSYAKTLFIRNDNKEVNCKTDILGTIVRFILDAIIIVVTFVVTSATFGVAAIASTVVAESLTQYQRSRFSEVINQLDEKTKIKEMAILYALSQLVNDPNTTLDRNDLDADGDSSDQVSQFVEWYDARVRIMAGEGPTKVGSDALMNFVFGCVTHPSPACVPLAQDASLSGFRLKIDDTEGNELSNPGFDYRYYLIDDFISLLRSLMALYNSEPEKYKTVGELVDRDQNGFWKDGVPCPEVNDPENYECTPDVAVADKVDEVIYGFLGFSNLSSSIEATTKPWSRANFIMDLLYHGPEGCISLADCISSCQNPCQQACNISWSGCRLSNNCASDPSSFACMMCDINLARCRGNCVTQCATSCASAAEDCSAWYERLEKWANWIYDESATQAGWTNKLTGVLNAVNEDTTDPEYGQVLFNSVEYCQNLCDVPSQEQAALSCDIISTVACDDTCLNLAEAACYPQAQTTCNTNCSTHMHSLTSWETCVTDVTRCGLYSATSVPCLAEAQAALNEAVNANIPFPATAAGDYARHCWYATDESGPCPAAGTCYDYRVPDSNEELESCADGYNFCLDHEYNYCATPVLNNCHTSNSTFLNCKNTTYSACYPIMYDNLYTICFEGCHGAIAIRIEEAIANLKLIVANIKALRNNMNTAKTTIDAAMAELKKPRDGLYTWKDNQGWHVVLVKLGDFTSPSTKHYTKNLGFTECYKLQNTEGDLDVWTWRYDQIKRAEFAGKGNKLLWEFKYGRRANVQPIDELGYMSNNAINDYKDLGLLTNPYLEGIIGKFVMQYGLASHAKAHFGRTGNLIYIKDTSWQEPPP